MFSICRWPVCTRVRLPLQMCKGCKQTKASSEFYRNRTNADGLFGKCKLCSDKQADANRRPRVRHNVTEPTVESKARAETF